jgi:hypothetical protein
MVRALQLATVRTFLKGLNLQRIMAATHAALGRRSFSLGDSHLGTCSISKIVNFCNFSVRHWHWQAKPEAAP